MNFKRIGFRFWISLYHLLLYPLFVNGMRFVALWSPKVRRGLRGRRDWRGQVGKFRRAAIGEFRIHFHAASVGEFEQAKPIIEALRATGRAYRITASFFSPSGYEQQRGYSELDGVCYLPYDRQTEMSEFVNRVSPDLVVIIRYDLWLEFLRQTRGRRIPIVLVCGVLRRDSTRFSPVLRPFFERLYHQLSLIHAVSEEDAAAFRQLVPEVPVEVTGDTRYDRVVARARSAATFEELTPELIGGRRVLVAGSTWPPDEELLQGLSDREDLLLVIVPHEPSKEHVDGLLTRFPETRRLSELAGLKSGERMRTLIVDRTGILSGLYRIGDIAYVGGAFGQGVHSVLEPAAYGMPVFCGPKIERSRDAMAMEREGGLQVVRNGDELRNAVIRLLDDTPECQRIGDIARAFVDRHAGATGRILDSIRERKLLP